MNSGIKVDRISVLPKNIIDSILSCLEIGEAVRTSILSRSWRFRWHSISKITINFNDLFISWRERVNIIDRVLSSHCGLVEKFELNISLVTDEGIERWILYVSKNGVKELILNSMYGKPYNLPSSLFSCSDLRYLELVGCICEPPSTSFKGFHNLTELHFHSVKITHKVLENLVNSCPLLSRLSLSQVDQCPSLKINAPNLVKFHTRDIYCYFQFENTPLLASASFGLKSPVSSHTTDDKNCKIVELLGSMPVLEELKFDKYALQHLAVGDVPDHLPFTCPIKLLTMFVNFEDLQEVVAAFCIFRSSPYIRVLHLAISLEYGTRRAHAYRFWEGETIFNFRFDHLEKVDVTNFSGSENEFKFIKFVLANAPVLKTMMIGFRDYVSDELSSMDYLIRLPRISPKAVIRVHHGDHF